MVRFLLAVPAHQGSTTPEPRKLQRVAIALRLPALTSTRRDKTAFSPWISTGLLEKETARISRLLAKPRCVAAGWISDHSLRGLASRTAHATDALYALSHFLHLEHWLRSLERK